METLSDRIKILEKNTERLKEIANSLVPKLMYVQHEELAAIKKEVNSIRGVNEPTSTSEFFIKLIIGLILYRENKYLESLDLVEHLKLDNSGQPLIIENSCLAVLKGLNHRSLGQKEKALSNFHFAIDNLNTSKKEAYEIYLNLITHYQIAELNCELNNIDKMLALHIKFYELSVSSSYPELGGRAANGIGRAYFRLKDYKNSLKYFEIAEKSILVSGNTAIKAKNWHDMALVYGNQNLSEKCLELLNKSLRLREENNFTDAMVSSHIEIAKTHQSLSAHDTAYTYLNKALVIAEKYNYEKKLLIIYRLLSIHHEAKEAYKDALFFNKKYHLLSSKLNDILKTQKENEKVREVNTILIQQKEIISKQKNEIESFVEKLKEKNSFLENFASIAAHDLKAPIRTIASFSRIIERKHAAIWDQDDKDYLAFITGGVSKLSTMIDALLSLSRLNTNLPAPQAVNIKKLTSDIYNRLAIQIKDLDAKIIVQETIPDVMGHESLIGQLFQNLIENALKYRSDQRLKICINCATSTPIGDRDYLQFEIKDNGQGIDENFQSKMFELFSSSDKQNSNGIGLATCKRVVRNYGGEIWVESQKGVGASIFFTLPKAR